MKADAEGTMEAKPPGESAIKARLPGAGRAICNSQFGVGFFSEIRGQGVEPIVGTIDEAHPLHALAAAREFPVVVGGMEREGGDSFFQICGADGFPGFLEALQAEN